MKGTGLMESMMVLGLRLGPEGVGIEGSIGKALGMGLVYIGFIRVMYMLGNGQMGRVMGAEFIPAKMVAVLWGNSSGVSSMGLVTIISGMGTFMLENTLQTRCMDLECTVLEMGIGMKEPGTREEGKDWECTLSEMGRPNLGTGTMGFLTSQVHRTIPILFLLLRFIIPKYSMLSS